MWSSFSFFPVYKMIRSFQNYNKNISFFLLSPFSFDKNVTVWKMTPVSFCTFSEKRSRINYWCFKVGAIVEISSDRWQHWSKSFVGFSSSSILKLEHNKGIVNDRVNESNFSFQCQYWPGIGLWTRSVMICFFPLSMAELYALTRFWEFLEPLEVASLRH